MQKAQNGGGGSRRPRVETVETRSVADFFARMQILFVVVHQSLQQSSWRILMLCALAYWRLLCRLEHRRHVAEKLRFGYRRRGRHPRHRCRRRHHRHCRHRRHRRRRCGDRGRSRLHSWRRGRDWTRQRGGDGGGGRGRGRSRRQQRSWRHGERLA